MNFVSSVWFCNLYMIVNGDIEGSKGGCFQFQFSPKIVDSVGKKKEILREKFSPT